jgi:hypothetical protein
VGQGSNPWAWIGFVVLFIMIVLAKVISLKMTDLCPAETEEVKKAKEDNTAVRGSLDLIHENRKRVPTWKTVTGKRRSQMEGKDIFEQIGVR